MDSNAQSIQFLNGIFKNPWLNVREQKKNLLSFYVKNHGNLNLDSKFLINHMVFILFFIS